MENAYGAVLANYTVNDFAFSEILIPNIGQPYPASQCIVLASLCLLLGALLLLEYIPYADDAIGLLTALAGAAVYFLMSVRDIPSVVPC